MSPGLRSALLNEIAPQVGGLSCLTDLALTHKVQ
jgi:hypothetical protein